MGARLSALKNRTKLPEGIPARVWPLCSSKPVSYLKQYLNYGSLPNYTTSSVIRG